MTKDAAQRSRWAFYEAITIDLGVWTISWMPEKCERNSKMEHKVLVAVDDSMHCRTCLSYLRSMFEVIPDLSITLYHVQPTVSVFLAEEARKNLKAKKALEKVIEKNRQEAVKVLDRCKEVLARSGLPVERVETYTSQKITGLAKDIIDKGLAGQYDAIVVGRRGISGLQKWVMGSVSSKLVEHSPLPVWIVSGKSFNTRFMVAVDGSVSALKALDHVLFMVGGNPSIGITLFHVRPTLGDYCVVDFGDDEESAERVVEKGNRMCLEGFYGQVRHRLKEHRVDEKRITHMEVDRKLAVGKTILDTAKEQNYGTVVIGRRGMGRSFYMGSVSNYIIKNTVDRVVWMVP